MYQSYGCNVFLLDLLDAPATGLYLGGEDVADKSDEGELCAKQGDGGEWDNSVMLNAPKTFSTLDDWLTHAQSLHDKAIDLGLDRVREVWQRLEQTMPCPVITVAGTNGKGSTCAMLEAILREGGYRTAVYASPHLVRFEERLRLDTEAADAALWIQACEQVDAARCQPEAVGLTYFEFTTLAALVIICKVRPDVAILEVGLGGRLDAVNLVDPDCAILTSMDLDHTALLGDTREQIGWEKAHIMRAGRPAIVSDPVPPQTVMDHAREIGADIWRFQHDFNYSGDKQQWSWAGRGRRYAGLAYPALRGANQLVNAAGVLAALDALRPLLPVTAQAVRNGLAFVELPGRFQIVPGQPALVLDVAHNPHSVAALAANLDAMGFYPCTHAVFGAMADKDVAPMLVKLAPIVDKWYFCDLPTPRAMTSQGLQTLWQTSNHRADVSCSIHPNPEQALQAAVDSANPSDRIVVFGSFYTVGGVLQNGIPRLAAKHLGAAAA